MIRFKSAFEEMNKTCERIGSNSHQMDTQACFRLASIFQDMDILLREHMQDIARDDLDKIVKKLKNSEDLSPSEIAQIRLWIIGDAESYSKMENNFNDWINELKRLTSQINQYATDQPDLEKALALRGLLRGAMSLTADIIYFLQQKERVKNFEKNIDQLTLDDQETLIKLLEKKQN